MMISPGGTTASGKVQGMNLRDRREENADRKKKAETLGHGEVAVKRAIIIKGALTQAGISSPAIRSGNAWRRRTRCATFPSTRISAGNGLEL